MWSKPSVHSNYWADVTRELGRTLFGEQMARPLPAVDHGVCMVVMPVERNKAYSGGKHPEVSLERKRLFKLGVGQPRMRKHAPVWICEPAEGTDTGTQVLFSQEAPVQPRRTSGSCLLGQGNWASRKLALKCCPGVCWHTRMPAL